MPFQKNLFRANLDERQTLRLALLLMAGLLLLGGTWIWVNSKMHQEEVSLLATRSTRTAPTRSVPKSLVTSATKANIDDPSPRSTVSPLGSTRLAQQGKQSSIPAPGQTPALMPGFIEEFSGGGNPRRTDLKNPAGNAGVSLGQDELAGKTQPAGGDSSKVKSALPVNPEPQVSPGLKQFPATNRLLAQNEARQGSGKTNPCERVEGYQSFPRAKASERGTSVATEIPPPPPQPKESFVPPPPPTTAGVVESVLPQLQPEEGLSVSELPEAPAKPSIAEKLKLVGVIGDKAVLACTDRMWRKENKWPKTITLGRGEQFESLSLVEVSPDSITLEEDGERLVKRIEPLK